MRTTVDLPDDVHRAVTLLARDRGQTLSGTVASLLRAALSGERPVPMVDVDERTGLPTVALGRRITAEDVAMVDDDG